MAHPHTPLELPEEVRAALARQPRLEPRPLLVAAVRARVAPVAARRSRRLHRAMFRLVDALLDGELPEGARMALEGHAAHCAECACVLERARAGREVLRGVGRLSVSREQALRVRLAAGPGEGRKPSRLPGLVAATASVALLLGLGARWLAAPVPETPASPAPLIAAVDEAPQSPPAGLEPPAERELAAAPAAKPAARAVPVARARRSAGRRSAPETTRPDAAPPSLDSARGSAVLVVATQPPPATNASATPAHAPAGPTATIGRIDAGPITM